jgi:hypothetical protein
MTNLKPSKHQIDYKNNSYIGIKQGGYILKTPLKYGFKSSWAANDGLWSVAA